jgi:hypothetical protein
VQSRWDRFAPLTGVLAVVLTAIGFAIAGSTPDFLDEAPKIAEHYQDDPGKLIAAAYIGLLGTAAFIWFIGVLRTRLRNAEGGEGWLWSIAFGGGLVAAAMFLLVDTINLAAALRADEDGAIDPNVAAAMFDLSGLLIAIGGLAGSATVLATAAVAFRTRVLPKWLGWISILLGIGLLSPISWIFAIVFLVWTLVVAVLLFLSSPTVKTPPVVGTMPDRG